MLSLLKYCDLQQDLHEEEAVLVVENHDKAKATLLAKKNIQLEVHYIVHNFTRLEKSWSALHVHFSSWSKKNIQNARRAQKESTIKSCSFDISTYLQKQANAINAQTDLDVKVNDSEMADHIHEELERNFPTNRFSFSLDDT